MDARPAPVVDQAVAASVPAGEGVQAVEAHLPPAGCISRIYIDYLCPMKRSGLFMRIGAHTPTQQTPNPTQRVGRLSLKIGTRRHWQTLSGFITRIAQWLRRSARAAGYTCRAFCAIGFTATCCPWIRSFTTSLRNAKKHCGPNLVRAFPRVSFSNTRGRIMED